MCGCAGCVTQIICAPCTLFMKIFHKFPLWAQVIVILVSLIPLIVFSWILGEGVTTLYHHLQG